MLFTGLTLLASLLGSTLGCGDDAPPPNTPPSITCPTLTTTNYKADKKKTFTKVTWGSATATDKEDKGAVTIRLKTGKGSGSVFGRGSHTVAYEAQDSKGLKDFCSFTFTVEVIQCRLINYIRNGRADCEGRSYYGHTCTFSCDPGYELRGAPSIECQKTGEWSKANPVCVALECPVLDLPAHGLGYTCTNDRKAQSICWLQCDESKGYGPMANQFTKCGNNQVWSALMMRCKDIEKPRIENCPTGTIVKTKDPNSSTTVVKWDKTITVVDNSGEDIALNADKVQADGKQGIFLEGVTLVKFVASDSAGNEANYCTFLVRIQTITCDPPKMNDTNIETPGCVNFKEGQSCSLSCYLALKLQGPTVITCTKDPASSKGYWSWGQNNNPPAETPHCQIHNCTNLPAPKNGAMVCEKWYLGLQCQMQCRQEYDVPANKRFPDTYLCQRATGKWNYGVVPGCEWKEPSDKVQKKGYYYFTGSCFVAKEVIKANFLEVVKESNSCPKAKYCKVENVEVRCGDEDTNPWGRRKRALRARIINSIRFSITVPVDKSVKNFTVQVAEKSKEVTAYAIAIMQQTYYKNSTKIVPIRRRLLSAIPLCRPGLKLGTYSKDACVPCPQGSYHNVTEDECTACPLGQYQNQTGKSFCELCPDGMTTTSVANNETAACEEMCKPGHFSPNGVEPCGECPVGTYTASQNTTECTHCPTGMTTEIQGADSKSKCLPSDIMLQGPVSTPLEGKTPVQICDFTFAVWVKSTESAVHGIRFELANPVDGISLRIEISSNIEVTLNGVQSVVAENVLTTQWHHVAVIWSSKTIKIYDNNTVVKTQALDVTDACPSSRESAMQISIRNYAYVYLRDLNFLAEAKPEIIAHMAQTCSSYLKGSLFSFEQLNVQSNTRILQIIPSTCLRDDPCDPNPCGDNVCIPGTYNVTCACKRGYTGPKCETPPNYCEGNICKNNATCYVSDGFACSCPPGFAGKLCERRIADGGWSDWFDWSRCSTTCGPGAQTRMRFCTNPTPDPNGKPCAGSNRQTQQCNEQDCPVCDASTLILGKGVTKKCTASSGTITCDITCQLGKVLPEPPIPYVCTSGFWTPTRQTVSCTDPVTPIAAGINYTVVYGNDLSSQNQVQTSLDRVGHDFTCSKASTCDVAAGSMACSDTVPLCHKYGGAYYGSLVVKKDIPQNPIDVVTIQGNDNPYIKPLFNTWTVFAHRSDELVTPRYRPLEMEIDGNDLKVYPHDHTDQAVIVPGQFGAIMKTWKFLDNTNWEVRSDNYTTFKAGAQDGAKKPLFLTARQMMTCPTGSVRGGVFCMKCPPGKYYRNGECKWCTNGLYQDLPGQMACKVCPAFKTTEEIGSSDIAQCTDTHVSELHILLGMTSPKIGVLDMIDLHYREMSMMPTFSGNVDYLAYNPRTKTIFFSTQSPSTIGRVRYDGQNKLELLAFPAGTVVTGLDVDIGSDLLFYMTNKGLLVAYHILTGAQNTLLSNLPSSSGLVLDQHFGIYWMETATIRFMHYGDESPRTIYTDSHTIWGLAITDHGTKLMWQSNNRLRGGDLDGTEIQILSVDYTDSFGETDKYFFTVQKHGDKTKLIRENRDRSAYVSIHDLPSATSRIEVINSTNPHTVDQLCLPSHSDCSQGCFPFNATARKCFCMKDYTLQNDLKSCRRDFSASFIANDSTVWYKPTPSQYTIPPSKTLRFNVKACHSAKLGLVHRGRELYLLRIDHRVNNKTYIDLIKQHVDGVKVNLKEKEISLLDCNQFRAFWITWQYDQVRRVQALKVGFGPDVDLNTQLFVSVANAFSVNYVQFGVGFNATAHWQF